MKVKELIKELKECDQELQVGVAMHDNSIGEVAGWAVGAEEVIEKVPVTYYTSRDGDKCVVIHC